MADITLISGACDFQHSKVIRHIITHPPAGIRICAIVADFTSLNLDPDHLADSLEGDCEQDPMPLRLKNGSVCYGLISSADYIVSLIKVCQKGFFDVIVLELPPTDNLLGIIESVEDALEDNSASFPEPASLDAVVSVVNVATFSRDIRGKDFVQDRYTVEREDVISLIPADLHVSELLSDQIELSNIVVLEGDIQATAVQREDCNSMLTYLNPTARVTKGSDAYVDATLLLQTNLYNGEDHAGWSKLMHGQLVVPPQKNVQHFLFNARRPFHPVRLNNLLRSANAGSSLKSVFRSMGYVWLASRPSMFGVWSSSGPFFKLEAGGVWFAATPKSTWPTDAQGLAEIRRDFCDDPAIGDRRQEFVLIGKNIDHLGIETELSNCLLTDYEYCLGVQEWKKFQDPFDEWQPDDSLLPSVLAPRAVPDQRTQDAGVKRALDLKLKRTT